MPRPLTVDAPFPTTEGLSPDAYSLRIISPAYSSSQGELNATLQYVYHSFFFEREGYAEISQTLQSIAVAEMLHFGLLGRTILALGAPPVFCQYPPTGFNFYSAKFVSYSTSLVHMLEDDILGERRSIAAYLKMEKCLNNVQVKEIVSRILQDEKLHLERLTQCLRGLKG